MSLRLTSIQRFSVNDGPGIRTVLFTKGCSIRCPWCANPENISAQFQYYKSDTCPCKEGVCVFNEKCIGNDKKQILGYEDWKRCPIHAMGVYGKDWEIEKLKKVCLKDKRFYGKEGGVTASGGEALLQANELSELFYMMQQNCVSCCIETSLFAGEDYLRCIIDYLNYIYIDMKILDVEKAKKDLTAEIALFENNLRVVFSVMSTDRICIRVPLVKEYTCTEKNIRMIGQYLKFYRPALCEIFSVHNLGKAKYETLGMDYNDFEVIDVKTLQIIQYYLNHVSGVKININSL